MTSRIHSFASMDADSRLSPYVHDAVLPGGNFATEHDVLNSISDGVYVTDLARKIIYWSKGAERILGWTQDDVLYKHCGDNLLRHRDMCDNSLCTGGRCPLLLSMQSQRASESPEVIYARHKNGASIPLQISSSPMYDAHGSLIGGVETFRDATQMLEDMGRARAIQRNAMRDFPPEDKRLTVDAAYFPVDLVGGDFYSFDQSGPDQYSFFIADFVGHGISAALYAVQLRIMLDQNRAKQKRPGALLGIFNKAIYLAFNSGDASATAIAGVLDLKEGSLTYASAGHPSAFHYFTGGDMATLASTGLPMGMLEETWYATEQTRFEPGDTLFCYTDCAVETRNPRNEIIGHSGLAKFLTGLGFPRQGTSCQEIHSALRSWHGERRLEDDLTLISIRRND